MATTSRRSLSRAFRPARNGRRDGAPIYGTARLGRRTKDLVKRLGSADVAVIDHRNLDRIAAEELVAEIVRMLGGERGDATASQHARELLEAA